MDNIAKPLQKDFVSTYDMIMQEGIEKGAMENTIKLILNGHKNGISIRLLAIQTELTTEEVEQILKEHGVEL